MTNLNDDVVTEFRANSGTVTRAMGGVLAHLELALLHHTGRRSGKPYIVPLAYVADGDGYLMIGSFAGAATEPQWVANVESATQVTVEIGTRTSTMIPTVLRDGPQRDSLYQDAREHWPFLLEYEKQTSRPSAASCSRAATPSKVRTDFTHSSSCNGTSSYSTRG